MFELNGKYNSCKVFTDNCDNSTVAQIQNLMNQPFVEGSKIRVMPDTHAGIGSVVGMTMTLKDRACPNIVGCDIGCGVLVMKLKEKEVGLPLLDKAVRECIPFGAEMHKQEQDMGMSLDGLRCGKFMKLGKARKQFGTLGGGNHFIELDRSKADGSLYLVIHSGSRYLGVNVCSYYQAAAYQGLIEKAMGGTFYERSIELAERFKKEGREKEISGQLKILQNAYNSYKPDVPYTLAYVEGQLFEDYIHDMKIVQKYAAYNRASMAAKILCLMGLHKEECFESVHNYIDTENMVLRKGAVSARKGEKLIIPINMRDGSLICTGKGNDDWNESAPHGAGRLLSRSEAKEVVSLEEYIMSMEGIYTTSVSFSTIDESPFVYKPMDEIVANVADTVDIVDRIVPVYNFKASEEPEE